MKKIIVVDDLPDQIFTVKQALEQFDDEYEVIGASSSEQCLELLNKGETPDLILSETRMPSMTGRELLEKLKENPAWENIPVVFLTAWGNSKPEKHSNLSSDDFIEKPFDMRDLKQRIDTILKEY